METLKEDIQNLNLDEEKEKKKKKKLEERSNLWAENGAALQYPLRPGEPDCAFYMKNGCCGYGSKCRFNHPPMCWWWNQVNWWVPLQSLQGVEEKENKNRPERVQVQQTECKFYLMPEGCKYGKSCKYSHSAEKPEVEQVELNILGLPFRPGERECPYYLRTGCCKFSANCWFHHPEPVSLVAVDHSSVNKIGIHACRHASGGVSPPHKTSSHWERTSSDPLCALDASPSPFVPKMLLPHQMVQKDSECGEFQENRGKEKKMRDAASQFSLYAPTSLSSQRRGNVQRSSPSIFTAPAAKVDKPINPHRNPLLMKPPSCMLSPLGLPIRQDKPICTYYEQYGICKYGPSCKFNHPIPSTMKSSMEFSSSEDAKTQEAKLNPLFEQSV